MFLKKIFVIFSVVVSYVHSLDWCDKELCPNGGKHIACKNSGGFHKRCEPDVEIIDLRPYRDLILHEHNNRRNFVAQGLLPGYYPAARMATLQWDDELEFLAELNVRTCVVDHDECRNSYRFQNIGQNLVGIAHYKHEPQNITAILLKDIFLWYTEHKIIDSSFITSFKVTRDFEKYGHFAEFVLERNTHVGCSMIRYTYPKNRDLYIYNLACDYASVYAYDAPVYAAGKPGSGCKTGTNRKYPSLCSTREVYNPNY
ncbi:antigen 5 like allergen Cul n 1-like [Musca domestica]|uniref:Antigen 5 like allergen Cul n 1-like n=1 Tax=Musca domestica TaxID=7370 RepID=A0A9J7DJA4_MUSDO|nr:antigen 5 like allergen Cul n 1-like [Musca domestica]